MHNLVVRTVTSSGSGLEQILCSTSERRNEHAHKEWLKSLLSSHAGWCSPVRGKIGSHCIFELNSLLVGNNAWLSDPRNELVLRLWPSAVGCPMSFKVATSPKERHGYSQVIRSAPVKLLEGSSGKHMTFEIRIPAPKMGRFLSVWFYGIMAASEAGHHAQQPAAIDGRLEEAEIFQHCIQAMEIFIDRKQSELPWETPPKEEHVQANGTEESRLSDSWAEKANNFSNVINAELESRANEDAELEEKMEAVNIKPTTYDVEVHSSVSASPEEPKLPKLDLDHQRDSFESQTLESSHVKDDVVQTDIGVDGIMLEIEVCDFGHPKYFQEFSKRASVGRHPANDIVLNDRKVSAFHVTVEPNTLSTYTVTDLGALNGTILVGSGILPSKSSVTLSGSNTIALGKSILHIRSVDDTWKRSSGSRKSEVGHVVAAVPQSPPAVVPIVADIPLAATPAAEPTIERDPDSAHSSPPGEIAVTMPTAAVATEQTVTKPEAEVEDNTSAVQQEVPPVPNLDISTDSRPPLTKSTSTPLLERALLSTALSSSEKSPGLSRRGSFKRPSWVTSDTSPAAASQEGTPAQSACRTYDIASPDTDTMSPATSGQTAQPENEAPVTEKVSDSRPASPTTPRGTRRRGSLLFGSPGSSLAASGGRTVQVRSASPRSRSASDPPSSGKRYGHKRIPSKIDVEPQGNSQDQDFRHDVVEPPDTEFSKERQHTPIPEGDASDNMSEPVVIDDHFAGDVEKRRRVTVVDVSGGPMASEISSTTLLHCAELGMGRGELAAAVDRLFQGTILLKVAFHRHDSLKRRMHIQIVNVDLKSRRVYWRDAHRSGVGAWEPKTKALKKEHSVSLDSVRYIVYGTFSNAFSSNSTAHVAHDLPYLRTLERNVYWPNTKESEKMLMTFSDGAFKWRSFSIVTHERTYDFIAFSDNACSDWVLGLQALCWDAVKASERRVYSRPVLLFKRVALKLGTNPLLKLRETIQRVLDDQRDNNA